MFKPKVRRFLEDECNKVIDKLKAMSSADLRAMSSAKVPDRGKILDTVAVYPDGRKATMTVFVKQESPECLLVIVQCSMPMKGFMGRLGIEHVQVDGFRRYADGRTEQVVDSTLNEYE